MSIGCCIDNPPSGVGTGTVTNVSVIPTTDITGIVSNPSTSPSLSLFLTPTGVTAGSYTNANITLDADGRVLLASNGTVSGSVTSVTGLNTDNTNPSTPIVRISVDGVTITGAGTPASPLVAMGGSGSTYYTWAEITSATLATVNYAYVTNNSSVVTVTLPLTASFGDKLQMVGKGAGGWRVAQNSGQAIHYGNQNTTVGVVGRLDSQNPNDTIEMVCTTVNTDWTVLNSQGNITVT